MKYIIMGDPVPLSRPRYGKGMVYDSQKHTKLVVGIDLRNQHNDRPFYEGPIQLDVTFFLKIPKHGKTEQYENTCHIYKPDLSNLIKFVEDIGSGIIYKDDCIITSVMAHKKYSENPRTEFEIILL